jgi:hypothetical protein
VAAVDDEGTSDRRRNAAMTRPSTARTLATVLLVVSAVAFVIGVSRERSAEGAGTHHESGEVVPKPTPGEAAEGADAHNEAAEAAPTATTHSEAGESGEAVGEQREAEPTHDETAEAANPHDESGAESAGHDEENRDILGIDPESTGVVAAAVALSLLLAAAVWTWGTSAILAVAVAFGLVFAALDVREAFHQADESRGGLVALALLIAALHAGVAVSAGAALKEQPTGRRTSAAV